MATYHNNSIPAWIQASIDDIYHGKGNVRMLVDINMTQERAVGLISQRFGNLAGRDTNGTCSWNVGVFTVKLWEIGNSNDIGVAVVCG